MNKAIHPGSIAHSRVPGFSLTVLMLALAAGGSGCAGGAKGDLTGGEAGVIGPDGVRVKGKSRPIGEVKEREAAAIEARRIAAEKARAGAASAEGTANIPEGDEALAEWLRRAEDGGLVNGGTGGTGGGGAKKLGTGRKPAIDPDGATGGGGVPVEHAGSDDGAAGSDGNEATAFLKNASTASPSGVADGTAANAGESVPATSNTPVALPTVSASDAAIVDSTVSSSRPLAALVKLHAAKAAGDARVSDAEIQSLEKSLTPAEAEFYGAWKALQASVAAGADASADVAAMKRAASAFAQATRGWAELRVPKAVLCTRVEGFGMYNELRRGGSVGRAAGAGGAGGLLNAEEQPAYTFLAGRKNKFIVYCEIDGFASRPSSASGRAGFEVEISQDLTLFAPGSGGGFTTNGAIVGAGRDVIAWRRPDQRVKDFSRNQRRDFFMVQIVELPETLTVGAYTLKVRIKDLASDGNAEAEAVIPIDIVADASALGR